MSQDKCPVEAARVVYENRLLDQMEAEIPAKSNSPKSLCSDTTSEIQSAEQTDNQPCKE